VLTIAEANSSAARTRVIRMHEIKLESFDEFGKYGFPGSV